MDTDAPKQIAHHSDARDLRVRIQLRPGHQYECAFGDVRMRQGQVGLTRLTVGIAEQVKIERPRPPSRAITTSPLYPLDREQGIQKVARLERRPQLSNCVDEGGLISNTPGLAPVKTRVAQHARVWKLGEREQRPLQLTGRNIEIAAESYPCAHVGALSHHFRWSGRLCLSRPGVCVDVCARVCAEPVSLRRSM